jgi:3-dehydroquinate synthase
VLRSSLRFAHEVACELRLGAGAWQALSELWRPAWKVAAVIGDETALGLFGPRLESLVAPRVERLRVLGFPPGEAHKTRETKARLEDELLAWGLDRGGCVLAVGGGLSLDVAGFVAATYQRGVPWLGLPTSLLAQVDACLGGKVAVNTPLGKNLVGAFHQPAAVLVEPAVLGSLPAEVWRDGLAEVVKHALVADLDLFEHLEAEADLLRRPHALDEALLARALAVKAACVQADEREQDRRLALNLGHTVGHALEAFTRHDWSHGQAVAFGLRVELRLAARRVGFPAADCLRVDALLARLGFPPEPPGTAAEVLAWAVRDKKRRGGELRLALPETIGRLAERAGRVALAVEPAELEDAWRRTPGASA